MDAIVQGRAAGKPILSQNIAVTTVLQGALLCHDNELVDAQVNAQV